jgi:DNA invertase Pin-like site-specific DNA recombinase
MAAYHPADDLVPAIGYIRVSTAREEMISPELQRGTILQWAARTGHRIIDWVEDLDKTGRNFKRRIMEVIERVERGEAPVIAVWKFSRFGRTRVGVTANLARVEEAGGQLLSATEEVDTRTSFGRFQRGVIMELNALESERAGEQWKETHEYRRAQGLPSAGRPRYGYTWHPRKSYAPNGQITLQEERYEPDDDVKDVVASLYRRYAGGAGFPALAAWLNTNKQRTTRGSLWGPRTLQRYMDSGFAAGFLRVHDPDCTVQPYSTACPNHKLVPGQHKAIIKPEDWAAYLRQRKAVGSLAPRLRSAVYPTTGLTRCGLCRGTAMRSGNKQSIQCAARRRYGPVACKGTSRLSSLVEEGIRDWLEAKAAAEIVEDARLLPAPARPVTASRDSLVELREQVSRIERAIGKHMRVYAMVEGDDPDGTLEKEYLQTLANLRAEKSELSGRLAKLETAAESAAAQDDLIAEAMAAAADLQAEWDTIPPARANSLLRKLIRAIYIFPNGRLKIVPVWVDDDGEGVPSEG